MNISQYQYIIVLSRSSPKCQSLQSRLSMAPFEFMAGETTCQMTGTEIIFIDNQSVQKRVMAAGITHVPALIQLSQNNNMEIFGANEAFQYVNSIQELYNQQLHEKEMQRNAQLQLRLMQNQNNNLIPQPDTDHEEELAENLAEELKENRSKREKRQPQSSKYNKLPSKRKNRMKKVEKSESEDEFEENNDNILEPLEEEEITPAKPPTVLRSGADEFEVTNDFDGEDVSNIRPVDRPQSRSGSGIEDLAAQIQAERDAVIPSDNNIRNRR